MAEKKRTCVRCGIPTHNFACKDCTYGCDAEWTRNMARAAKESERRRVLEQKRIDRVLARDDNYKGRESA